MIRIQVLGPLELSGEDGQPLHAVLAQEKRTALLAFLAFGRGGFVRRDALLAMFWPESDLDHARAALSKALHFLRRELGDGVVLTRGDADVGVEPDRIWCDAVAFDAAVSTGKFGNALDQYRGDLLPAFHIADAPAFEEWMDRERTRLRDAAAHSALGCAANAEREGDLGAVAALCRRALEWRPYDEAVLRRLMSALQNNNDRAGVVREYKAFAQRIRKELQIEPSAETRAIFESVVGTAGAVSFARGALDTPAHVHRHGTLASNTELSARSARRFRPVLLVAAGLTVVAGLAAAALWTPSTTQLERDLNILLPDSLPAAVMGDAPLGIWQRALAISRDGRRIAYVARTKGINRLAVRQMDAPRVAVIAGTEGAYSPFFSPDGEWIGFFVGFRLKKVRTTGGQAVVVANIRGTPLGGAWPTPDRIVVASGEGQRIEWWPAAGGALVRSDSLGTNRSVMPQVLPGLKAVLTYVQSGLQVITLEPFAVWALTPRGLVRYSGGPGDMGALAMAPPDQIGGHSPIYSSTGHIVYASVGDGGLLALPFDATSLEVLGAPVPILDRVRKEEGFNVGQFALADDGTLAYLAGGNGGYGYLALADPGAGRIDTLPQPRAQYSHIHIAPDASTVFARVLDEGRASRTLALDVRTERRQDLPDALQSHSIARVFDRSTALTVGSDRDLHISSLETGVARKLGAKYSTFLWPDMSRKSDVVILRKPGGRLEMRRLGGDTASLTFPERGAQNQLSPDGRWLAYRNSPNGLIAVSPVPPTGVVHHVTATDAEQPRWSARGDRLYYRTARRVWSVDVSAAGGFRVGPPQLVLSAPIARVRGWSYDVAADGRVAVVLGSPEEALPQINVIIGFGERLKRLVPR